MNVSFCVSLLFFCMSWFIHFSAAKLHIEIERRSSFESVPNIDAVACYFGHKPISTMQRKRQREKEKKITRSSNISRVSRCRNKLER